MSDPARVIDLDHNATTVPLPEVVETVAEVMRTAPGNPDSRHPLGRAARKVLEESRETVAAVLGAAPNEVVFTSGGTESNNLAIRGLTAGRTGHIALPPGEHPAVDEPIAELAAGGFRRVEIPIDQTARLRDETFDELPWDSLRLVATLLAHNEVGTIRDVSRLAELCLDHRVPLHIDAVQAVGKIAVDFHRLQATTLSLAAHKFHGPRGVGALLVRTGVKLTAELAGGRQEGSLRPGTPSVALAAGMARALELWQREQEDRAATMRLLRDRLQAGLEETCRPVTVHAQAAERLPNTLTLAIHGVSGEALLIALDVAGVCCSLGSACASGSMEPAPVLLAMGLAPEIAASSLRLSVGFDNTAEEIDEALSLISQTVTRLRSSDR